MRALRLVWGGVVLALLDYFGTGCLAEAQGTPALGVSDTTAGECWTFTHQVKAGGSTVKAMLRNMWGPQYFTYGDREWHRGDAYAQSIAEDLVYGRNHSVVAGGYVESLRRSSDVGSKCKWFTVFRHPISRLVSAYYFCKVTGTCASELVNANQVDITAFAKHWGNRALRQFVLSFVSIDDVIDYSRTDAVLNHLPPTVKRPNSIPGGFFVQMYLEDRTHAPNSDDSHPDAVLYAMLQPVQDMLRDQYSAIGILEEYDTTLSIFNAALDMPGVDWHEAFKSVGHVNVNDEYKDERVATLAEAWTNSEVKHYLQLDILLYEHALAIFQQQASAYNI